MSPSWAPQRNTRHVRKLGTPTQRKRKRKAQSGHVHNLGTPTQRKARPQVGRPNTTQGEFARWSPKRKTHPQRKRPHKGALGKKTSWRMDKNKFWLGGRLFNTTSPRLGAPMQRNAHPNATQVQTQTQGTPACPQVGRPNATQGTSARWSPKQKLIRNENVHTREH
jgi:hypothetical protein